MTRYLFGKRNSIHIIDIRETVKGLLRAKRFVSAIVAQGYDVLFVGTKRQARESIAKQAQRVGMPFAAERWLGGTLTNFRTIRSRLARLEELEQLESSGGLGQYSKKMQSSLQRELDKIRRNLQGIRNMSRLPGALIVLDAKREYIAVREARKLGLPTIGLVDTDSDPDEVDVVIPGNDDAMRAIDLIVSELADAVEEGKRSRPAASEPRTAEQPPAAAPRRARRSTTPAAASAGPASGHAENVSAADASRPTPAPEGLAAPPAALSAEREPYAAEGELLISAMNAPKPALG